MFTNLSKYIFNHKYSDNNIKINVALANYSPIGVDTIEHYVPIKKIMEYKS